MKGIDLLARVDAVAALQAEFGGRDYQPGTVDCVVMARAHLARLGHVVPELPAYTTERGGLMKLKRLGYANIAALLDEVLEPIPPARMMVGDVALLQGDVGDALTICAGRKLIGFREGFNALVNQVDCPVERAWRA